MTLLDPSWRAAFVLPAVMLAGCATYRPMPLPHTADLHRGIAGLDHQGVDIERPLSVDSIVRLAVLNDPDLRDARYQKDLAAAQVIQAGLLPNPQFTPGYQGNLYAPNALDNAWTAALAIDMKAVIERPSLLAAARAGARQVDASVLWQEWQVMGQARLLAIDLAIDDEEGALLRRQRDLFATRTRAVEGAVRAGNATVGTLAPDLAAAQGADDLVATFERASLTHLNALDALLGLVPGTPIDLATPLEAPPIDPDAIRASLATIADRRPDLAALRFGYQAEEARLRAAIIGQFPALVVSLAGGRDNTRDYSVGPQPTFDLPIFNHNQGQIAIERATRDQLRAQYDTRITRATADVEAMLHALAQEQRQLEAARSGELDISRAARDASGAFQSGLIDEIAYVDLMSAAMGRAEQVLTLRRLILEQRVAIATLIGAGLPRLEQSTTKEAAR